MHLQDIASTKGYKFPDQHNIIKIEFSSYIIVWKAAVAYLGIGGVYWDLCSVSKNDCHDVEIVWQY